MKKPLRVFFIIIALLIGVGFSLLLVKNSLKEKREEIKKLSWSDDLQLEYANTLIAKGLNAEGAEALESYIEKSQLGKKDLASVCHRLGNIYMDIHEYEKALKSFYKSELLDSQSEYKAQMNERIVEALESLGLDQQAKYELETRTSVTQEPLTDDKVVARIGKREITESQINQVISKLPEQMKAVIKTDEGKLGFIKDYVASEVLYSKAKMLGLDKNTKVREYVEDFKKQLTLQQLFQMEIEDQLKMSPQDLELYFKANKNKYIVLPLIKLSYIELKDETEKEKAFNDLKEGKGIKVEQWIREGQSNIADIADAKDVISMLFKQEKASTFGPAKINDKLYVFSIDEKVKQRELSFEEAKGQLENDYRLEKQQALLSAMLQKAIEQEEVEILFSPEKKEKDDEKNKK